MLKVYEKVGQKPAKSIADFEIEFLIKFLLHESDVELFRLLAIPQSMQRSKEYQILLKVFIEFLEAFAIHGLKQIYDISELKYHMETNFELTEPEKQLAQIEIEVCQHKMERNTKILKVCGKLIPTQVPPTLRCQLMTILNFAIQMESLNLVLFLLKPLSEYDTCLSTLILALATPDYRHLYDEEIWAVKDVEELNEFNLHYNMNDQLKHAQVVRKIAQKCKNPNTPNSFGSTPMHLAAKFGLFDIFKVLIPFCNNLDAVNREQKTALQLAEESGHHKIVKLLTQMKLSK